MTPIHPLAEPILALSIAYLAVLVVVWLQVRRALRQSRRRRRRRVAINWQRTSDSGGRR